MKGCKRVHKLAVEVRISIKSPDGSLMDLLL
jgi:hypothetical protein